MVTKEKVEVVLMSTWIAAVDGGDSWWRRKTPAFQLHWQRDIWVHDRSNKSSVRWGFKNALWLLFVPVNFSSLLYLLGFFAWSEIANSLPSLFFPPQKYSWMTSCWHTLSSWHPTSFSRFYFSSILHLMPSIDHVSAAISNQVFATMEIPTKNCLCQTSSVLVLGWQQQVSFIYVITCRVGLSLK